MKAAEWIDRVKAAKGWESDYRVAKELSLSRQTVSGYRGKIPTMDEETSMKVAHVLELNPAVILADQAMERARNDEARQAWQTILERLGGLAAGVLIVVGLTLPPPSAAATVTPFSTASEGAGSSVYYVKLMKGEAPEKPRKSAPSLA